jgi:cell division protein FtsW (lipid II flippase)
VVAVVPWALYFYRQPKLGVGAFVLCFLTGFCAALANVTRFHSGTAVLFFVTMLLLAFRTPIRQRTWGAALVLAGFLVPVTYFHVLLHRRDVALEKLDPRYEATVPHHVFWHSIYVGL